MKINRIVNPSGDWEAWYLDGKLIYDGHHLSASDLAKALEIPIYTCEISDDEMESLSTKFPDKIRTDLSGGNFSVGPSK